MRAAEVNCHTGSRSATLRHGQVGELVGEAQDAGLLLRGGGAVHRLEQIEGVSEGLARPVHRAVARDDSRIVVAFADAADRGGPGGEIGVAREAEIGEPPLVYP